MVNTRALLLALALSSVPSDDRRLLLFRRRRHGYVATLALEPAEYRLFGLVERPGGIDVLWQYTGRIRLRRAG